MMTTREVMIMGLAEAVLLARTEEELVESTEALGRYLEHVRRAEGLPDTMGPGWNRPAPASTHDVTATLINAAARVAENDSWEGTITWTLPDDDEPELEGAEFGLMARYRIGNRDGQGGLRVYEGPQ